ncbi:MAG: hypothetical protein MAG453_00023 [Calditrichaeota bacterium]|nr:hypothetical protein [Calditrichota bacterium]
MLICTPGSKRSRITPACFTLARACANARSTSEPGSSSEIPRAPQLSFGLMIIRAPVSASAEATSSADSTDQNSGTGTPASRSTRLLASLSTVSAAAPGESAGRPTAAAAFAYGTGMSAATSRIPDSGARA